MHLVLESRLFNRDTTFLSIDSCFNILLIYDDTRLVTAARELLITAAAKMHADNAMRLAICQSDLLMEPLLVRVAVEEVSAAHMLIIVARPDMPNKWQDWATAWSWTHPLARPHLNFEKADDVSQGGTARLENIGTLDTIELFALGGGDFPGAELKKEIGRWLPTLAKSIPCCHESFETFPATSSGSSSLPGNAARDHDNPVHAA